MSAAAPRVSGFVCQLCRAEGRSFTKLSKLRQQHSRSLVTRARTPLPSAATKLPSKAVPATNARPPRPKSRPAPKPSVEPEQRSVVPEQRPRPPPPQNVPTPTFTLESLVEDAAKITSSNNEIPDEVEILEVLDRCHDYANFVIFGQTEIPQEVEDVIKQKEDTATSSLLDLEEPPNSMELKATRANQALNMPIAVRVKAAETICGLVYDVLRAKNVYITPPMLELFVRTECLLGNPQYLPAIFYLYANKPIPTQKTSPVIYKKPWPKSPKNAIPRALADTALEAAIAKKDLPLAIAIIDTTVALPAFKYGRIIRRASIPFLGAVSLPLMVWQLAERFAEWQVTWDIPMAKFIVMSSSMAYLGTLGIVGFVALTTYNDHFERVVWRPGMTLRDRWIREDERLYFDRVAMAWGFRERWKRGEEQGEEWEALRETVGIRNMVLDKSELLEGME